MKAWRRPRWRRSRPPASKRTRHVLRCGYPAINLTESRASMADAAPWAASSVRSRRSASSVVALLAVRNLAELVVSGGAYLPTNVALGAALVALARGAGSSWEELGLERRHLHRGLTTGGAAAAGAVGAMALAAAAPATRRLFDDQRVPRCARPSERLYQTVVRIPVGTVAFEELAFRGVLLGLLRRCLRPAPAVAVSSVLFGLWHVVPTLATARANQIGGLVRVGLVTGSVLATTAAGAGLCGLRMRARHLLAPALLHLGFNDAGYVLAWRIRARHASSPPLRGHDPGLDHGDHPRTEGRRLLGHCQ